MSEVSKQLSPQVLKEQVTQMFVNLLNDLLKSNPDACKELLSVQCEIQDPQDKLPFICRTTRGKTTMGVLGFINTALNELGANRVAVCHDGDSDQIVKFIVNEHCQLTPVTADKSPATAPQV